jgi:hypothetical protein
VAISLVAILSGFVVMYGLLTARKLDGWTAFFLTMTVLTSVTAFLFPIHRLTPGLILAAISLVVLAIAIYARYGRRLGGAWRWIYVLAAVLAFYLNFFVLIVQSFLKIPALKSLAPNGNEPPFVVTQVAAVVLFLAIGIGALVKFRVGEAPVEIPPAV